MAPHDAARQHDQVAAKCCCACGEPTCVVAHLARVERDLLSEIAQTGLIFGAGADGELRVGDQLQHSKLQRCAGVDVAPFRGGPLRHTLGLNLEQVFRQQRGSLMLQGDGGTDGADGPDLDRRRGGA